MGETLQDIKKRRSVRAYTAEPVKAADLDRVLEAGTWAPTGHGAQSPRVVVIQQQKTIAEIEKLNAAALGNPSAKPFYGAPVLIVVFADTQHTTWAADGNMVIANLLLAASALGLGSCYINRAPESFESEQGRALVKKWGIADTCRAVGNVVLGYAAQLPEAKARKPDYIIKVTE